MPERIPDERSCPKEDDWTYCEKCEEKITKEDITYYVCPTCNYHNYPFSLVCFHDPENMSDRCDNADKSIEFAPVPAEGLDYQPHILGIRCDECQRQMLPSNEVGEKHLLNERDEYMYIIKAEIELLANARHPDFQPAAKLRAAGIIADLQTLGPDEIEDTEKYEF